jgi:hypothetical protein
MNLTKVLADLESRLTIVNNDLLAAKAFKVKRAVAPSGDTSSFSCTVS